MTTEEQRIAIAEVCGYSDFLEEKISTGAFGRAIILRARHSPPDAPPEMHPYKSVPDYLNDLNAMHEVLKILLPPGKGKTRFVEILKELVGVLDDQEFFLIHSTASQQAEAFLRTLNLWKDSPHDNH